jgi:hypothetical protein
MLLPGSDHRRDDESTTDSMSDLNNCIKSMAWIDFRACRATAGSAKSPK